MNLSTKLVASFLGCGLIPLGIVSIISYSTANNSMNTISDQGEEGLNESAYNQLVALRDVKKGQIEAHFDSCENDMNALVETVNTVRDEAFQRLRANRDVKRAAVERYFQSIHDQILTFSEDRMIVDAMRGFRQAFADYRKEAKTEGVPFDAQKNALRSYYTGDFVAEYRKHNDGQSPDVEKILNQLDADSIALQYAYITQNPNPLGSKHRWDRADDGSSYSAIHGNVHPLVRSYLEKFGYYDVFLVDSDTGNIVYSVFKELDYGTSLKNGPYADTNFGEAFRKANAESNKDAIVFEDYAQYGPSYEAPASFIASPIYDGSTKVGVAIFQMPIDRLNTIMAERSGLGKTGETYLVGPDFLMRSDSYLDPDNHSVAASFRRPDTGKVDTTAIREGLSGHTGAQVISDYNGNPVLSAYCPVKVGDSTWTLAAEIDVAEAFCPKVEGSDADFFTKYANLYGYYDLFLINPDGFCFYTVCHEADYGTNLVSGKYKDSHLGGLVRKTLASKGFGFADFAPYAASNDEPAAFIAQPVVNNGKVDTIVALQLSLKAINDIMGVRAGMGETGETYLVGNDNLMRSDSYLNPQDHSVKASFADPSKGAVDTDATREALAGTANAKIISDYNGNPVLSAYAPVKVFDTTWALLAEIDESEAMAAVTQMEETGESAQATLLAWTSSVAVIAAVLVTVIGLVIARSIIRPLREGVQFAETVASGDLTHDIKSDRKDEIGTLTRALSKMANSLRTIMQDIANNAQTLAGASTELSATASHLAEGAEETTNQSASVSAAAEEMSTNMTSMAASTEEMSTNMKTIASAVEEMTATIAEVAKNAEQAASVAQHATGLAETSNANIGELDEAADAIGKVIETIQDIAEQTNLLALNATIEAARAGDAGKGFAVVASEVKDLAKQSAEATEDIRRRIEGVQGSARTAVGSIEEISGVINQISDVSRTIAAAVEQQSVATKEISHNLSETATAVDTVTTGVSESASAVQEVTRNITGVDQSARQSAESAGETQTASGELSVLGEKLQALVGQFKV